MNKTVKYVIGRILFIIPIMLILSFFVFALTYLSPSDPVTLKYQRMGEQQGQERDRLPHRLLFPDQHRRHQRLSMKQRPSLQEVQQYLACTDHLLYCNQLCMNKEAWDSLDPAYQAAVVQAASEAIAYMRPLMEEVDAYHKQKLAESGMQLIEYDAAFYEDILALEGVQAVYDDIDRNQVDGLGTLLAEELRK